MGESEEERLQQHYEPVLPWRGLLGDVLVSSQDILR